MNLNYTNTKVSALAIVFKFPIDKRTKNNIKHLSYRISGITIKSRSFFRFDDYLSITTLIKEEDVYFCTDWQEVQHDLDRY